MTTQKKWSPFGLLRTIITLVVLFMLLSTIVSCTSVPTDDAPTPEPTAVVQSDNRVDWEPPNDLWGPGIWVPLVVICPTTLVIVILVARDIGKRR